MVSFPPFCFRFSAWQSTIGLIFVSPSCPNKSKPNLCDYRGDNSRKNHNAKFFLLTHTCAQHNGQNTTANAKWAPNRTLPKPNNDRLLFLALSFRSLTPACAHSHTHSSKLAAGRHSFLLCKSEKRIIPPPSAPPTSHPAKLWLCVFGGKPACVFVRTQRIPGGSWRVARKTSGVLWTHYCIFSADRRATI